jgi:hypothetical protein
MPSNDSQLNMYIVLAKVTAANGNEEYPEGEKHAVLAYAKASNNAEAEGITLEKLATLGWIDLKIDRIGIIDPEPNKGDSAVDTANETGFSAVIYQGIES